MQPARRTPPSRHTYRILKNSCYISVSFNLFYFYFFSHVHGHTSAGGSFSMPSLRLRPSWKDQGRGGGHDGWRVTAGALRVFLNWLRFRATARMSLSSKLCLRMCVPALCVCAVPHLLEEEQNTSDWGLGAPVGWAAKARKAGQPQLPLPGRRPG